MPLKHPKGPAEPKGNLSICPIFSSEVMEVPRHALPDCEMAPDVAYQIIHDGLMLGGLALKRRWQHRRAAEGKPAERPNIVMGRASQGSRTSASHSGRRSENMTWSMRPWARSARSLSRAPREAR